MVRPAFLLLAASVLAAPSAAKTPRFPPSIGQSALYSCADGRMIEVLYSGGDAAVLTIGGATVQMDRSPAPSGELYVGGGWRWWGRSVREGRLGKPDADTDGISCRVR
jgi:membrane-bound inhibitor of C-type lysozyme